MGTMRVDVLYSGSRYWISPRGSVYRLGVEIGSGMNMPRK
jgi:hypothetical protein